MQQDPRTQAQNYGPANPSPEMPGFAPPPGSYGQNMTETLLPALDAMDPEQAHFAQSFASAVNVRTGFDQIMKAAAMGQGPDDLRQEVEAQQMTQQAMQMAQETMKLSEQQFAELMAQLEGTVEDPMELPELEQPQAPSDRALAISGALALAMPRHGGRFLAQPYQYEIGEASKRDQRNMQKFQMEQMRRKERIGLIEFKLEQAAKARDASARAYYDLADQAQKKGDALSAKGLEWRGKFNSAKNESELDGALSILETHFPEFKPSVTEVNAARKRIQDEAKAEEAKTKLINDTAKATAQNTVLDNRRADFLARFPQGTPVTQAQVEAFNKETSEIAGHYPDIPKGLWFKAVPRDLTPAQDLAIKKFEFDKDESKRHQENFEAKGIADGTLVGPIGNTRPNPNYKAQKGAKSNFGKLNTEADKARKDTDAWFLANRPSNKSMLPSEFKEWFQKLKDIFAKEYVAVMAKRAAAGQPPISTNAYWEEQQKRFGFNPQKQATSQVRPLSPQGTGGIMPDAGRTEGKAGYRRNPQTGAMERVG